MYSLEFFSMNKSAMSLRMSINPRAVNVLYRTIAARRGQTVMKCAQKEGLEPSAYVIEALRHSKAICFDVDSTFCQDESIDEIAKFLGVGEEVAALTSRAMGGTMDFKSALEGRLSIMAPTQRDIENFLMKHPHQITQGIPELVKLLQAQNKAVFLVSGGFRQIIHPLAIHLGIPLENVFANSLVFKADGTYAGFDENEFTCRSGGKPAAIRHIKETFFLEPVVMVGDGATDLEARLEGAADLFIGYGGVVERRNVAEKADWYIYNIQQMIDILAH
ncbi:hypothetical protein CEUSTIGMA_g11725.t1 [Chlamydomonas eustigma]|uniref:phosphoserine phosphatase n=1 Tax=Chlamydomonas eustigma TaxID=1157962 RepID=A0A250XMQ3_9CHLO|nr:hypothetical protein CEUSTIGMA_g11725.t1 [Chlamydomonas eustigma]|eukprot:GAX84303.1 hypothetical protein CEUSTIGMA_g11725.t1 [Chlamydomonas eustigma]